MDISICSTHTAWIFEECLIIAKPWRSRETAVAMIAKDEFQYYFQENNIRP